MTEFKKTEIPRFWLKQTSLSRTSLWFVAIALACLIVADLEITTLDPWPEMGRLAFGLATPNFAATDMLAFSK